VSDLLPETPNVTIRNFFIQSGEMNSRVAAGYTATTREQFFHRCLPLTSQREAAAARVAPEEAARRATQHAWGAPTTLHASLAWLSRPHSAPVSELSLSPPPTLHASLAWLSRPHSAPVSELSLSLSLAGVGQLLNHPPAGRSPNVRATAFKFKRDFNRVLTIQQESSRRPAARPTCAPIGFQGANTGIPIGFTIALQVRATAVNVGGAGDPALQILGLSPAPPQVYEWLRWICLPFQPADGAVGAATPSLKTVLLRAARAAQDEVRFTPTQAPKSLAPRSVANNRVPHLQRQRALTRHPHTHCLDAERVAGQQELFLDYKITAELRSSPLPEWYCPVIPCPFNDMGVAVPQHQYHAYVATNQR
jgi:hypothetical protein